MNLVRSVCAACGYTGAPYKKVPGSFGVELLLWLFFLVPGAIYSMWRLTSGQPTCPACDRDAMIPTGTPRGWELVKTRGGWSAAAEQSFMGVAKRAWIRTMGWALFSWFWVIVWFTHDSNFMGTLSLLAAVPMSISAFLNFPRPLPPTETPSSGTTA